MWPPSLQRFLAKKGGSFGIEVGFYPMAKGQRTDVFFFQIRDPQRSGRKKEA